MATSDNIFQAVQTYQKSALGRLQNLYAFIATMNTKFKNFQDLTANLGSSVTFDLPPRMISNDGLVVSSFDNIEQRVQTLTVDQSRNVNFAVSAEQLIFNIDNNNYRDPLELSAMTELGSYIESNVASNILNSAYRFFGDGVTPINSFQQIATALAYFRNYGADNTDTRCYLDDIAETTIVGSGLNQFVMNRNEDLANSWQVGRFSTCDFLRSNLLPVHTAGSIGEDGTELTVVSINAAGTQITVSGAGISDADAIKENDLLYFKDNVSGEVNMRYLTFIGHQVSKNPVQVRATADAESDGSGNIVIPIYPALVSAAGRNQNINTPVSAGMKLITLPTHRAGMICSGNALFLGMPRLPDQSPFSTANNIDEETGVSIRFTQGAAFGQNQTGFIFDAIWGATFVPEYCMRLVFPL